MSGVLIIGGYGEFGGRLAQLLIRDQVQVYVAGRNLEKAQLFCDQYGGQPVKLDINTDLDLISTLELDVVVDAAGPFQLYSAESDRYRVARKALECGSNYLDLCDDGEFISGISALDAYAKQQNLFVLSGASSTPAITGAAINAMRHKFERIDKLEASILPGSRAPQGYSVMQAILDQVGNGVLFWRSGQWVECTGWSEPAVKVIDEKIKRRANLIATADTVLFPEHFKARSVLFRAGLAGPIMHNALQGLGSLRSRRYLPNLTTFIKLLRAAANCITPFGSDRGGMLVEVIGNSSDVNNPALQHSKWILQAEPGQGPFVPAIPVRALIQNLEKIPTGARACINELPLEKYEAAMHDIGVRTESQTHAFDFLFSIALGAQWQSLPDAIRNSHQVLDRVVLSGEAKISRGTSWLTQAVAWLFRFPQAIQNTPVQVVKTRTDDKEIWVRDFNGQIFRSTLSLVSSKSDDERLVGVVQEQFGLMKFVLQLSLVDNSMHLNVLRGSCFGVPIPLMLLPISDSMEFVENNILHFSVRLLAPFNLGLIVHYEGWLK